MSGGPVDAAAVRRERHSDRRGLTAIDGVNALIVVLVVGQMWLLSAALESALAGRVAPALPATIAWGVLFAECGLLYRFVKRMERQTRSGR